MLKRGNLLIQIGKRSLQHLSMGGICCGLQPSLDVLPGKNKAVALATAFDLFWRQLSTRSGILTRFRLLLFD